jgi:DNA-binding GntR family transcriptional regulator
MEAISDLPMLHDIDADYSPQYVKLARIIRGKIESGQYKHGDPIPAASLVREHRVSMQVAWNALAMLAANKYVTVRRRSGPTTRSGTPVAARGRCTSEHAR